MNRRSRNFKDPSPRRFYRDPERGRIFGVCAGIADYTGMSTCVVRWLMFIAGLIWFPLVEIVYVMMGFMVPIKPKGLYKDVEDEEFWQSLRKSPSETFGNARYRFRQLDQRMQRMERYVTSRRFRLDREFRDLENESQ
ncbi:MAG: envelope stress response membrane protein PspC [Gammaproteobacteria bacterium]|nr:envelope stress response membrane protein PspC [Gammaproteobacteria bacterium]MDH3768353.1 envelope stress response membrane protein PspC [Gammaproteobacteria bacterium]